MNTAEISKTEALALMATDPNAYLLAYADAATGAEWSHYVKFSRDLYTGGPRKSQSSWFSEAYEAHAKRTGVRPACSIVYTGATADDTRMPLIRTDAENVKVLISICADAEAMSRA